MGMDREAWPFVAFLFAFSGFAAVAGSRLMAAFILILAFCIGAFFRDPVRIVPEDAKLIISPADGKIVEIVQKESFPLAEGKTFTRISIFLNVFDVHINRSPIGGQLTAYAYHPGKFLMAHRPKASLENEQSHLLFTTPQKQVVGMKQIAGWVARRVVTRVKKDDMVKAGDRIGLIRFGSRVDVFIPSTAQLKVKVGDRVKGGSQALATL